MLHVPPTGAAPASTALVAGRVDVMLLNTGPAEAAARDGRAKIIAVGAPSRIPLLPNTPTLAELGMPIEAANWFGLLGPAGTPATLANRIAEVAAEGPRPPQVQEVFRVQAALRVAGTPGEMRDFVAADRERWAAVVGDLNIRLE